MAQQGLTGGSARNFVAADEIFRRTLTEGAGKAWAWQVVVEMKAQMDRMRVLSSMHFPVVRLMAQHLANIDAIAANDAATAEQH